MKFNVVIKPETNIFERIFPVIAGLLFIIIFGIGLVLNEPYLLISLPIWLLQAWVFNKITKGKFKYKNWIQSEQFEINLNYLKHDGIAKKFYWSELSDLYIEVDGYDSESRTKTDTSRHHGTDNFISFKSNQIDYEFFFYLPYIEEKENLIIFLRDSLIPVLNSGEVKIFLNKYDGYKTYTIS